MDSFAYIQLRKLIETEYNNSIRLVYEDVVQLEHNDVRTLAKVSQ